MPRPLTNLTSTWVLVWIFAALCVARGEILAAKEGESAVSKATASQPASRQAPVTRPGKPAPLRSPRATVQQFLLAVEEAKDKPERIKDAVACLDLSAIPEDERAEQGPKRAAQLEQILGQSDVPPLETIPKEYEKDEYPYLNVGENAIVLARGGDGLWRFSAKTVESIPALFQSMAKVATTQPVKEEVAAVPPEHRSARATMRTFISAVNAGDLETAARCLDLSERAEGTRAEVGRDLALRLKQVIDRIRLVVLQELPDDPTGESYPWHVDENGRIELAPALGPEHRGEWLFTKQTVHTIDKLFKASEEKEVVEGAEEIPFWTSPSSWIRNKIPPALKEKGFLLEHWQWVGIVLVLLVGVLIHRVVSWILARYVRQWLEKQHVKVDRSIRTGALRPFGILVMVLFWRWGFKLLALEADVQEYLTPVIKFVVIAVGIWALYRLVDLIMGYAEGLAARTESKLDDLIVPLLRKSLKVIIAIVGVLLIASAFVGDTNINRMLAGLGLGGLAFALAAQDTIKNFFGSLTIILDRPFQVGDWVVIGDVEGTVETVGFRSSKIRTFYNSLVSVPNGELMNTTIDNYGVRRYRRIKRMISVTYSTPPEALEAFCEGIRELIRRHPYTRKDYFQVYVNVLESSSIDILLYCFLETPDWSTELRERHRLFLDIIRLARNLGIEFAFPTQTIHLDKEKGGESAQKVGESGDPDKALALGRKEAADIAASTPGPGKRKPPPVTFSPADNL